MNKHAFSSTRKGNWVCSILPAALALLLAASTAAQAETIYLQCDDVGSNQGGPHPFVITVDLTNQTVDNESADIRQTLIVWDAKNTQGNIHRVIDRSTGAMTTTVTAYLPGRTVTTAPSAGTCTKVSAATKF